MIQNIPPFFIVLDTPCLDTLKQEKKLDKDIMLNLCLNQYLAFTVRIYVQSKLEILCIILEWETLNQFLKYTN